MQRELAETAAATRGAAARDAEVVREGLRSVSEALRQARRAGLCGLQSRQYQDLG